MLPPCCPNRPRCPRFKLVSITADQSSRLIFTKVPSRVIPAFRRRLPDRRRMSPASARFRPGCSTWLGEAKARHLGEIGARRAWEDVERWRSPATTRSVVDDCRIDEECHRHLHGFAPAAAPGWVKQKHAIYRGLHTPATWGQGWVSSGRADTVWRATSKGTPFFARAQRGCPIPSRSGARIVGQLGPTEAFTPQPRGVKGGCRRGELTLFGGRPQRVRLFVTAVCPSGG